MSEHVKALRVLMSGNAVGKLSVNARGEVFFQYDNDWLAHGFDLSPLKLPFAAPPVAGDRDPFWGLHGVFNDSLPDGWGLPLMDRAMRAHFGWDREDITPLDRLAYIGARGMGALEYQPEIASAAPEHAIDIAALAAASQSVLSGETKDIIADLYMQGGSPGGARPKITLARNAKTGACLSGFADIPQGYEHWMVKFRGSGESPDSGRIEMAYAEMAAAAGLRIPRTELILLEVEKTPEAFFAVRRFDRADNKKKHVLSLGAYLHADHRAPSLDYEYILAATQRLTRDVAEVKRMFRLMVFNVLAHNKDDHAKNFAFIGSPDGWVLSPAFDLTYSAGMGDEHTSAIAGKGNPEQGDILRLAQAFKIDNPVRIVDEVRAAVAQWSKLASKWKVSATLARSIGSKFQSIDERFRR